MIQQNQSKTAQYWADNHLVVDGNQYQLIDNCTQNTLFQFNSDYLCDALDKCYQFNRYGIDAESQGVVQEQTHNNNHTEQRKKFKLRFN